MQIYPEDKANPIDTLKPNEGINIVGQNKVQIFNAKPEGKSKSVLYGVLGVICGLAIVLFFGALLVKKGNLKVLTPYINKLSQQPVNTKTVQNPLTGIMYTPEEATTWFTERPLGVMVNNHADARPQSGVISADIVYEIVAEGGITRYLAFFLTNNPEKIGPVRSTREYYLVIVKELSDAMLMHIGWSPQALEAIETWPVRSLGRGGAQFWRDQARIDKGVAIEHTAYVSGVELRKLGIDLGWEGNRSIKSWKFKEDGPVDIAQQCLVAECTMLTIDFWYKGDYTGMFKYDRATNSYLRYTGYDSSDAPIAMKDQESGEQVTAKNVVVQFVTENAIVGDDKSRLTYDLVGSGTALVFADGKVTKATWSKSGRDERTMFYDESGNEIAFNRGKFWISVVPTRNAGQVVY